MTTSVDHQTILLIEDNEDDVFIFRRAYKQAQLPYAVQVAGDGQEALDYLLGAGEFADRAKHPLPFLVLLDLKVPLKPGLELLETIRSRPDLSALAVIVLTSSAETRDIQRARALGAQAFLVKPPSAKILLAAVESIAALNGSAASATALKIEGNMFDAARGVE